ncbi:MAG: hypothetical protein J2P25_14425 [Nocardiopsaceae bacterium]|nr:hypothetical protein [Nocardiopsaceae bacterium]
MSGEKLISSAAKRLEAADANYSGYNARPDGRYRYLAEALYGAQQLQSPETAAAIRAAALEEGAAAVEEMQHTRDDEVNDLLGGLPDRVAVEHVTAHKAAALLRKMAGAGRAPAACCHLHKPSGCCDPEDCGPCCGDCPTCPTLARQRAAGVGRLTPEREQEIRARADAAAPGPWRVERHEPTLSLLVVSDDATSVIDFGYVGNRPQNNAEFVAHAREDVPALLAEVARLRAELEQRHDDVTGACLARWEEEQTSERLRLALESAKRGRRDARARVAELEAQAALAHEYVIRDADGRVALAVRHTPGGRGGWCVMDARRNGGRRRVWTRDGWRWLALLSGEQVFCWPDGASASAEARRLVSDAAETGDAS